MDTIQRTLKKMPPSKLTGFLQEIVDSCSVACEDALTIVSELLDFEKLAAGRLTYSYFHLFLLWKQGRVYVYANDSISNLLSIYKSSHSMHPPTSHHITSHHTTLRRTTSSHHTIRHHNTLHSTTQIILTNPPLLQACSLWRKCPRVWCRG